MKRAKECPAQVSLSARYRRQLAVVDKNWVDLYIPMCNYLPRILVREKCAEDVDLVLACFVS